MGTGRIDRSADVLFGLLAWLPGTEHALIGYSRGGVVASETAQRLLMSEEPLDQVIYLDPEGGGSSPRHSSSAVWLYDDDEYWAWEGTTTHNYFSTYTDLDPVSLDILGGHSVPGAHNVNLQDRYAHSDTLLMNGIPRYLTGNGSVIKNVYAHLDGLFVAQGNIVTKDTPASATDVMKSIRYYAPEPLEIFNGNFEFTDSTAGWWYHGGGSLDNLGTVESGRLYLDQNELRIHNWAAVPETAISIEFELGVTDTSITSELVGYWGGENGLFTELGRLSLDFSGTFVDQRFDLPVGAAGDTGRVKFAVIGTDSARVWLDNISYSVVSSAWSRLRVGQPCVAASPIGPTVLSTTRAQKSRMS